MSEKSRVLEERMAYSPGEVADLLGLGKSKIYDMIRRQELPYVKLGSLTRIPRSALETWLRENLKSGPIQG